MRTEIAVTGDNMICALGADSTEVMSALVSGKTGVSNHAGTDRDDPVYYAALIPKEIRSVLFVAGLSFYEQLNIAAILAAVGQTGVQLQDKRTLLVLASTKGNIGLMTADNGVNRFSDLISLGSSAKKIAEATGYHDVPHIISNACISGISAIMHATRMMRAGQYDAAVVCGADEISTFVQRGFESFLSLSDTVCRPYDASRNGLNLGEAAAAVVLEKTAHPQTGTIVIKGSAVRNDANHLSGPSRTGNELAMAISAALDRSSMKANDIDFISAHGTATIYNDEMESKAFETAGLSETPLHSLKSRFGHTLGASGILESVALVHSMKQDLLLPTLGFETNGVSGKINVCRHLASAKLSHTLKTGSGFGGSNAAIVFSKI